LIYFCIFFTSGAPLHEASFCSHNSQQANDVISTQITAPFHYIRAIVILLHRNYIVFGFDFCVVELSAMKLLRRFTDEPIKSSAVRTCDYHWFQFFVTLVLFIISDSFSLSSSPWEAEVGDSRSSLSQKVSTLPIWLPPPPPLPLRAFPPPPSLAMRLN